MILSHGMSHYMTNFLLATGSMIAVLLLVYWYIRRNPAIGGSLRSLGSALPGLPQSHLRIESTLSIEPRKRLMVVAYRHQRFLVSSSLDKTEFMTALDPVDPEVEAEEARQAEQQRTAMIPSSTMSDEWAQLSWSDRLMMSTRMVLSRYFPQMGGK